MKDLLELMKTRRSVRKYKPDMIPQDVLDRIIIAELIPPQEETCSHLLSLLSPTRKCVTKFLR